jgi:hypothetical protein
MKYFLSGWLALSSASQPVNLCAKLSKRFQIDEMFKDHKMMAGALGWN